MLPSGPFTLSSFSCASSHFLAAASSAAKARRSGVLPARRDRHVRRCRRRRAASASVATSTSAAFCLVARPAATCVRSARRANRSLCSWTCQEARLSVARARHGRALLTLTRTGSRARRRRLLLCARALVLLARQRPACELASGVGPGVAPSHAPSTRLTLGISIIVTVRSLDSVRLHTYGDRFPRFRAAGCLDSGARFLRFRVSAACGNLRNLGGI